MNENLSEEKVKKEINRIIDKLEIIMLEESKNKTHPVVLCAAFSYIFAHSVSTHKAMGDENTYNQILELFQNDLKEADNIIQTPEYKDSLRFFKEMTEYREKKNNEI